MEKWIESRKHLHKYPELSGKEKNTAEYIIKHLEKLDVKVLASNFSQYSILASVEGTGDGPSILFRCELDALPIKEKNNFEYVSQLPDVSHKCGHDGHMTIMLALADKLVQRKENFSNVYFLFQSAEETGEGAKSILESNKLKEYEIDYVFALHNVPGYKMGEVLFKENAFTPRVESVRISLTGETSHAGQPETGVNPTRAIVELIKFFDRVHQPNQSKSNYFVSAPIFIDMGSESYGTTAGAATLGYTIRSFDINYFDEVKSDFRQLMKEIENTENLKIETEWIEPFESVENDAQATQFIQKAAQELNAPHQELKTPFDWGEDFGILTHEYKGAMFGLGAGTETVDLHHSAYDFPDVLIEKGSEMFYQIVKEINDTK